MARTSKFEFTIDPSGDAFSFAPASVELTEELGRPFELLVDIRSTSDIDPASALGKVAKLEFSRDGGEPRTVVGIVESVEVIGTTSVGDAVHPSRVRVVSAMELLGRAVGCRIFQDMDVKQIVAAVLLDSGIPAPQQDFRLEATYPKRVYCVQYNESVLAFVSRLCEEEGIYFFSEASDDLEKIVFADKSSASAPIDGDPTLPCFSGTLDAGGDVIREIVESGSVRSGEMVLLDYDFERPTLDLTSKAAASKHTDLSVFDYPGLFVEPSEGKRLAKVKLEAEQVPAETVKIIADCGRLAVARKMEIANSPFPEAPTEYVVIRVVHRFALDGEFHAEATLLPATVPFRTRQTTPRPIIEGPQTARVVAPAGSPPETIHTESYGRAKVKFHWDTSKEVDDKASCWMRQAQLQTSGSMMLHRLDWEAVVEFHEGNPDRPVIVGRLYNGRFMPPYALPGGRTRTSLRTQSTPNGGGTNEIRFEDAAGGEEILIQAQRDQAIKTVNNRTKQVGNNETLVVGAKQSLTVGANQTVQITKGARENVKADVTESVGGDRKVDVNAVSALTVGGNSSTSVGGDHFEMNGNPLEAIIRLAAEKAKEIAKEQAAKALEKVNAKIQEKVDQVMGPINDLKSKAEAIAAPMQAIADGDLSGIAGMAADAMGLPLPPGFGGDAGADQAGGEAGGDAEGGEGESEEGGEGEQGEEESFTAQAGIDEAVDDAIETGIDAGADALLGALGIDSEGGGGASTANADGSKGDVAGIDATDRVKGPGHNLWSVGADMKETSGTLRVAAAITGITSEIAGNVEEKIGAAKAVLTWGDITSEVGKDKTEKALGFVTISRADESEEITGSKTQMIGGAILEKVKGDRSIESTGPATLIGAFHKIEAATKITFKCGESEVVVDADGVTVKSPIMTVMASKITLTKDVSQV